MVYSPFFSWEPLSLLFFYPKPVLKKKKKKFTSPYTHEAGGHRASGFPHLLRDQERSVLGA